jgi:hypothetical protein
MQTGDSDGASAWVVTPERAAVVGRGTKRPLPRHDPSRRYGATSVDDPARPHLSAGRSRRQGPWRRAWANLGAPRSDCWHDRIRVLAGTERTSAMATTRWSAPRCPRPLPTARKGTRVGWHGLLLYASSSHGEVVTAPHQEQPSPAVGRRVHRSLGDRPYLCVFSRAGARRVHASSSARCQDLTIRWRVMALWTALPCPSLLKYAKTFLPAASHSCRRSAHHAKSASE